MCFIVAPEWTRKTNVINLSMTAIASHPMQMHQLITTTYVLKKMSVCYSFLVPPLGLVTTTKFNFLFIFHTVWFLASVSPVSFNEPQPKQTIWSKFATYQDKTIQNPWVYVHSKCDFSLNISHLKKNLSKIINALNFPVEFYFYCVLFSRFPSFPFLGSLFLAAASIAGNLGSCICAQCTMNNFLFLKPIIPWSIVTLN